MRQNVFARQTKRIIHGKRSFQSSPPYRTKRQLHAAKIDLLGSDVVDAYAPST
jgi:hypothetical protein